MHTDVCARWQALHRIAGSLVSHIPAACLSLLTALAVNDLSQIVIVI